VLGKLEVEAAVLWIRATFTSGGLMSLLEKNKMTMTMTM